MRDFGLLLPLREFSRAPNRVFFKARLIVDRLIENEGRALAGKLVMEGHDEAILAAKRRSAAANATLDEMRVQREQGKLLPLQDIEALLLAVGDAISKALQDIEHVYGAGASEILREKFALAEAEFARGLAELQASGVKK